MSSKPASGSAPGAGSVAGSVTPPSSTGSPMSLPSSVPAPVSSSPASGSVAAATAWTAGPEAVAGVGQADPGGRDDSQDGSTRHRGDCEQSIRRHQFLLSFLRGWVVGRVRGCDDGTGEPRAHQSAPVVKRYERRDWAPHARDWATSLHRFLSVKLRLSSSEGRYLRIFRARLSASSGGGVTSRDPPAPASPR